jgi:hypothetical protein
MVAQAAAIVAPVKATAAGDRLSVVSAVTGRVNGALFLGSPAANAGEATMPAVARAITRVRASIVVFISNLREWLGMVLGG